MPSKSTHFCAKQNAAQAATPDHTMAWARGEGAASMAASAEAAASTWV